jgi:hypothetical protein
LADELRQGVFCFLRGRAEGGGGKAEKHRFAVGLSPSPEFLTYALSEGLLFWAAVIVTRCEFHIMPALSHEQLLTAIELVCYFCTAVGVAVTFFFAART